MSLSLLTIPTKKEKIYKLTQQRDQLLLELLYLAGDSTSTNLLRFILKNFRLTNVKSLKSYGEITSMIQRLKSGDMKKKLRMAENYKELLICLFLTQLSSYVEILWKTILNQYGRWLKL